MPAIAGGSEVVLIARDGAVTLTEAEALLWLSAVLVAVIVM